MSTSTFSSPLFPTGGGQPGCNSGGRVGSGVLRALGSSTRSWTTKRREGPTVPGRADLLRRDRSVTSTRAIRPTTSSRTAPTWSWNFRILPRRRRHHHGGRVGHVRRGPRQRHPHRPGQRRVRHRRRGRFRRRRHQALGGRGADGSVARHQPVRRRDRDLRNQGQGRVRRRRHLRQVPHRRRHLRGGAEASAQFGRAAPLSPPGREGPGRCHLAPVEPSPAPTPPRPAQASSRPPSRSPERPGRPAHPAVGGSTTRTAPASPLVVLPGPGLGPGRRHNDLLASGFTTRALHLSSRAPTPTRAAGKRSTYACLQCWRQPWPAATRASNSDYAYVSGAVNSPTPAATTSGTGTNGAEYRVSLAFDGIARLWLGTTRSTATSTTPARAGSRRELDADLE